MHGRRLRGAGRRWRLVGWAVLAVSAPGCQLEDTPSGAVPGGAGGSRRRAAETDDAGSRAAFLAAYPVFLHPRCRNCHPAGDAPLQGDDSHPHAQNVKRGSDGRGLYALKCANCHQDANLPGENMPPGNPQWRLPPQGMPMVFQGRSPRELARQLKDHRTNGGKTLDEIVHHVTEDPLVLRCWNPGDGRSPPPLPPAEFARHVAEWVRKGAVVPE